MPDSFAETINRAKEGDEQAISMIIAEFSELIQLECRKFGLNQHPDWSYADLYQECLIRVLSKIDQFREAESENPRAALEQWIRVASVNWLNNLARNRKAKKRFPDQKIEPLTQENGQAVNPSKSYQVFVGGILNSKTSNAGGASLLNIDNELLVAPPLRHDAKTRKVQVGPKGKMVLTCSSDRDARLWQFGTENSMDSIFCRVC